MLGMLLMVSMLFAAGADTLWAKEKPAPKTEESLAPGATPAKPNMGSSTGLPVPRYVSLKSAKINVRRGPGNDYPIEWVFAKRGLPVEITAESNRWRRIRDRDGAMGWVWHGMLDGRRTAIVEGPKGNNAPVALHAEPLPSAGVTAYAEPGVIAELKACKAGWCELKVSGYEGWVPQSVIWGAYPGESFE